MSLFHPSATGSTLITVEYGKTEYPVGYLLGADPDRPSVELVIKRSETDRKEYKTELYVGDVLSFPGKYPHAYRAMEGKKVRIYVELFFTPGQSLSESNGETLLSSD